MREEGVWESKAQTPELPVKPIQKIKSPQEERCIPLLHVFSMPARSGPAWAWLRPHAAPPAQCPLRGGERGLPGIYSSASGAPGKGAVDCNAATISQDCQTQQFCNYANCLICTEIHLWLGFFCVITFVFFFFNKWIFQIGIKHKTKKC